MISPNVLVFIVGCIIGSAIFRAIKDNSDK